MEKFVMRIMKIIETKKIYFYDARCAHSAIHHR